MERFIVDYDFVDFVTLTLVAMGLVALFYMDMIA